MKKFKKDETPKKKEYNPNKTTWGKILIVVLCFAMVAGILLAACWAIFSNL